GAGGAVLHPEGEAVEPLGPLGAVVDGGGADVAGGQDVEGIVQRADLGGAEGDVLDAALDVAHQNPVPDLEGTLDQDHQSGKEVAGGVLRGQRDGQADQARAGDDAGNRQAQLLRGHQAAQNDDHHFVYFDQYAAQGLVGAHFLP